MFDETILPTYQELYGDAIAIEAECPGVQYLCTERRDDRPTEYYIVDTSSIISDEAKRYGTPFADRPDLLLYVLDDVTGGKAVIEYEIQRYRAANGLPMSDSEPLSELAEYAAELHPEYFGSLLPPRSTPSGRTLRWRAFMNGVYLHEAENCDLLVSVCPPLGENDLSDYTRDKGLHEQDCLFFSERDACLALFELAQSYPDLKHSDMIDWLAISSAIWKHHSEYAVTYNLGEQSGLHDPVANLLRSLGVECKAVVSPDNMIALSVDDKAPYLFFYRDRRGDKI